MSNKAVAQLLPLHEHTVKDLDTQDMRAQCWARLFFTRLSGRNASGNDSAPLSGSPP
jgi:hypothetical protein